MHDFLKGESSVCILQHEFSGSSRFMDDPQTCKVKSALKLELCVTPTVALHKINIM